MNLYRSMLSRKDTLILEITNLQRQLKTAPPGRLEIHRNKEGAKYYFIEKGESRFLRKNQMGQAQELAFKMYLQRRLAETEAELSAVEEYLSHYEKRPKRSSEELLKSAGYRELILPRLGSMPQELIDWMHAPYPTNPLYPEQLKVRTSDGKFVRSKSERLIYSSLMDDHVPFRYEWQQRIGNSLVSPDFTPRHPKTGQLFLWEHGGMMDDAKYASDFSRKIQLYTANGWIPMQNLILTTETSDHPLDAMLVQRLIEHFFLTD